MHHQVFQDSRFLPGERQCLPVDGGGTGAGVKFYRPFCKWLCPLGAFYALFNRVSLFRMKVDRNKCVSCGKCAKACKMDVDVTKTPNHTECIRCGMCIRACPTNAVSFRYGFGDGKKETKEPAKPADK